ncbi:MAG: leucyl aminopeptidase [Bifidobacteriaceae bacterium]|jgi:leucyl aminopeptidase|nr:leucyl aminopeptidase [Bifidobacteriaceae bacterium]
MTNLTLVAAGIRELDAPVVLTAAHPGGGVPGLVSPAALASLGFSGKEGEVVRIAASAVKGTLKAPVLAVTGLAKTRQPESLRRAVGAALRQLGDVPKVGLAFATAPGHPPVTADPAYLTAIAEGASLGAADAAELVLGLPGLSGPAAKEAGRWLARAAAVTAAVKLARRLTNEPPSRLYPQTFAEEAAQALKGSAVRIKVLDEQQLARDGYGGIVAVGQGSVHPPRLVQLTYSPLRAKQHVALVGKGITFDSGGLSLKSRTGMVNMKSDMAGAAAVLGAVRAASDLKLSVKLTAYLCLAENLPSGAATRPGDVVLTKDGHAVEVTNTDAEGRLVLADGIAAARAARPGCVIDLATLTGAQVVALGNRIAGVMGSEEVRDGLVAAAEAAGEGAWAMPLPDYLMEVFKSEVADFTNANLTDSAGGMLSAGLFLRQFAGEVPWAHIDCAGPAFNSGEPFGYTPKGGTGYGVRLLVKYLEDLSAG